MLTFAPDAIDVAPESLQAVSAIPTIRGYRSPPAGVDLGGDQFSGTPQGSATMAGLSGSTRTFVGTGTYLYEYASGSWTDRSRAGNYSAGSSRWRFAQFGDTELAINKATVLQQSSTGAFSNVSNSPKAALMEVCAGFVMLADCDDSGLSITGGPNADQGNRWWCSQIFNAVGSWAPSASTQATSGLLVETEGSITGLRRLMADCVAYKAKSMYLGRYVGPPSVWDWSCVSKDIGCLSHEAIVNAGTAHYFVGDNDIYMFDGSRPAPIGQLIREWFFSRLNRTYAGSIQSLHDRAARLIYWFYPTGSDATLNSVLVYHYDSARWGAFDLTVKEVVETTTAQITYDDLGTLFSTYADLPNIPYDSPFWAASTPVLAYLSSTSYLTSLSSASASMSLTTGYFGDENRVSVCTRLRPRFRIPPTAATLNGSTVMNLGDNNSTGTTGSALQSGRFDVLQAGRYHQFALTFTGACEIEGLVPTLVEQGTE